MEIITTVKNLTTGAETVYRVNNRNVTESEFRKYDLLNNDIAKLKEELRKELEATYQARIRTLEKELDYMNGEFDKIKVIILGEDDGFNPYYD